MSSSSLGFGGRTIGAIGGMSLLLNNCLGPGVAQMPALFQKAGWIGCIVGLIIFGSAAFISGWMLMYAQSRVPISLPRTEYAGICKYYLSHFWFLVSQVFFILTMVVLCVGGVLQTSQLMDFLFVRIFKKSCALEIYPRFITATCSADNSGFSVFPSGSSVISAGYALAALVTIPFGFFPLEDNIKFQVFSCSVMALCVLLWMVDFSLIGLQADRVPAVGESITGLVGTCMFNFCVAFSLPSWNNERKETVSVKKSLIGAIVIASVMMILVGMFAGTAFEPYYTSTQDMNDQINKNDRPLSITCMYLFSLANNITSIPVFSICIRYCLIEFDTIRPFLASLVSVLLPWLLVIPFSTGRGFSNVVDYGGMIFLSVTGFILPPILFFLAVKRDKKLNLDKVAGLQSEIIEHPSRSGSLLANMEFELIHGAKATRRAQIVAIGLLGLLSALAAYALISQIIKDAAV